jgi:hypothetical protein
MKLIENKYSVRTIKPKLSICPVVVLPPVKKPRSAALIKAQKKYYEKNKEKITSQQTKYNEIYSKLSYKCECGDMVSNSAKYQHLKSNRHIRRINNIKNGLPAGTTPGEEYIDCPCGGHYIYKQRHQHFRTQKHIRHVEEPLARAQKLEEDKRKEELEENNRKLTPEYTQAKLRAQLRLMLLGEGLPIEINNNVNSSEIKEL